MKHQDHVQLIKNGLQRKKEVWADLGSGDGAFTLAVAELLDPLSEIYSIEKDQSRLNNQKMAFKQMFRDAHIHFLNSDFTKKMEIPPLDGIIMANSLHYIKEKEPFLRLLRGYLKNPGKLIIVEYNAREGNMWVPYPLPFSSFETLALNTGFSKPQLIGRVPSEFLQEIYAGVTTI